MNVEDRSDVGIPGILQNILLLYNIREKLIAQAYYGAAVMSGSRNGVQALIKREYPHPHFRTVTPTHSTWLSKECVLIFLWSVYFSLTRLVFPLFFAYILVETSRLAESRVQTCASALCAKDGLGIACLLFGDSHRQSGMIL